MKAKKQRILDIDKSKNNLTKPSDTDMENMIKRKEIIERVTRLVYLLGSGKN